MGMKKPSKPLLKALKIISTFEGAGLYHEIWPTQFAKLMWPDSPCWRKVYNIGHGSTGGKGMWLCAGSYLNKLKEAGLVYQKLTSHHQAIYGITQDGWKILKNAEEE